jgi:hypothetical protein
MRLPPLLYLSIGAVTFAIGLHGGAAQAVTYTFIPGDLGGEFTFNPPSSTLSAVNLTYYQGATPIHTFFSGSGNGTTFQFGPTGSNTPFLSLTLSSTNGTYMGTYCPEERGSSGACRTALRQVTGSFTETDIPSPLSAVALLPLASISRLRKRYRTSAQVSV